MTTLAAARRYQQAGALAEAEQAYRQALEENPACAAGWYALGQVCRDRGQLADAVTAFREALRHERDLVPAHNSLGVVLARLARYDEAEACFQEVLRREPGNALAHNNRGNIHKQRQQLEQAAACYRQALHHQPGYAAAYRNLGSVLRDLGRRDEATAAFQQAVRLAPDDAGSHTNLGLLLAEAGRFEAALACYRRALALRPNDPTTLNNQGIALKELGRLDEAEAAYGQALALEPDYAEAHCNRAWVWVARNRHAEAVEHFTEALRHQPDFAEIHFSRALAWLALGDFERGWTEHEWRWRQKHSRERTFPQPRWDGGPLAGRTIFLYLDQGLGDTIQFIRFAPLLQQRGATVLVQCQAPLVRLLRSCAGIDRVLGPDEPLPPFDVHLPLMSLPWRLGTTLATIPAAVPYLSADPGQVEQWRQSLAGGPELKVGLVWQGNPINPADRHRSVALARFAPLARVAGVRLFSLQKGAGSEQLAAAPFAVTDLGSRLGDLADTAAVVRNLDLVIGVDTAVMHLAGALAVQAWVAVTYAAEWRWLVGRADSPWYPHLRLFRQKEPGNWDELFGRMAGELAGLAARG